MTEREAGRSGRQDLVLVLVVFLVAAAARALYLVQISTIPLFEHPSFDSKKYLDWAARLAGGDWVGDGVFFQAPLYPYFLGVLEALFGRDLGIVRGVQAGLGAVGCAALALAGRTLFGRAAGWITGIAAALYAPAVFHDGLIQKTSLDFVLISVLLLLLARAMVLRGRWALPAAGFVLGWLCLTRENALLWAPILAGLPWIAFPEASRTVRVRGSLLAVAGLLAVLLPVGLRNLLVGGEFALTTSQFGANFYIGNHEGADGTYQPMQGGWGNAELEQEDIRRLAERAVGHELTPGGVSSYWSEQAFAWIRAHPLDWLLLLGRKWMLVWNAREMEDADDYYLYAEWSPWLRALGILGRFGLLAPLAVLGLVLHARRWRELSVLVLLILATAAGVALFYVFGRYRFSMVPFLLVLAGAGVDGGWRAFRSGEFARIVPGLGAALLAALLVHLPLIDRPTPSAAGINNLANAFEAAGDEARARETYETALERQPGDAMIRYNLARILAKQGELAAAEEHLRGAIAAEPTFAEAHNNLGGVLGRQGRPDEALAEFRRAVELEPELFDAHMNVAVNLARRGRKDEAREHVRRALEIRPGDPAATRMLASLGD